MNSTKSSQISGQIRPRDELRVVINRMVAIRRLIRQHRGANRGMRGDAVKLTQLIEQLARLGQRSTAADALEIATRIEALSSILRSKIDGVIAP